MKKISELFIAGFITLCFSMSLQAQSSEADLDQVELMKQYIGNWEAEAGKDTTWLWEITPSNKGYVHAFYMKVKGKTVTTQPGIIGFADEYRKTNLLILYADGFISRDIGEFVSDNRYVAERFYPQDMKTGLGTWEVTFLTHDKFTAAWVDNGVKVIELIYTRVKE